MASIYLGLLLAVAGSPIEVTAQRLSGSTLSGTLVELTERRVVVETLEGNEALDASTLMTLQRPVLELFNPDETPVPPLVVQLTDGSQLRATAYRVVGGRAQIDYAGGGQIEMTTRAVRSVCFNKQDERVEEQWTEILANETNGDVIVIRKVVGVESEDGAKVEVGLDELEGVLFDINEETVGFEFDDTRLDVPRAKVEGVIYHNPRNAELPDPVCRLYDVDGSAWNARSVLLDGEFFELVSVSGARFRLPATQLRTIDYSAGNVVFLTDLEPESLEWRPYLGSAVTPSSLEEWFKPKWDSGIYGDPLMLGGQSYERGLALHSFTKIAYRLTGKSHRFLTTVGVDDRFRNSGNVRLEISSEKGTLFDQMITGDGEPVEVDVEVGGVRRLQIIVDFGDDRSDSGDHLNLCNARLTK